MSAYEERELNVNFALSYFNYKIFL
jgi:ribosomal RNA-processing protein 7